MFREFEPHVQIQDGVQNGRLFMMFLLWSIFVNALSDDGFVEGVYDSFKVNVLAGQDRQRYSFSSDIQCQAIRYRWILQFIYIELQSGVSFSLEAFDTFQSLHTLVWYLSFRLHQSSCSSCGVVSSTSISAEFLHHHWIMVSVLFCKLFLCIYFTLRGKMVHVFCKLPQPSGFHAHEIMLSKLFVSKVPTCDRHFYFVSDRIFLLHC